MLLRKSLPTPYSSLLPHSLPPPPKVDGITDRDKLKMFTEEYVYIFDFMFQLNAPFVCHIYQLPLHVSSNIVLIIRRIHCIHTASGSLYVTLLR